MPKRATQDSFLAKAKEIHGERYDYSKVVFLSMNSPIEIICHIHGIFLQKPSVHVNDKCGCPKCGKEKQGLKTSAENFIKKAQEVHGNKYDYSKVEYIKAHNNIIIICPKHGEFVQRPDAHIHQKQGCPKCGLENRHLPHRKTTEQFIEAAINRWEDKYNYSETAYVNKDTKLTYHCPKHGKIEQKPLLHLRSGCPYCNGRGISRHTTTTFINLATQIHNGIYDYSKSQLNKITDYVIIICSKHGEFSQRANNHIHLKNGCPQCDYDKCASRSEKKVVEFIKSIYKGSMEENDRKILKGKEIDLYLPNLKLGFEYHGMYWHVETVVGRKLHWEKANLADEAGIQLIQIYEDEWQNKREIVKSKIRSLLGLGQRIFARKTVVKRLGTHEKNEFLTRTHIQGQDGSSIGYGLFLEEKLVACMTFGTSRFNKNYKYELIRYSTELDIAVVGGASKLLKAFRKGHSGSIISYADRRWSKGNLYHKLGFKLDGITKPSFSYYNIKDKRFHNRLTFQKKKLGSMNGYSESLKEYEIMQLNGYDRIWDAGQYRFIIE